MSDEIKTDEIKDDDKETAIYFQPSPMSMATGDDGSVYIKITDFMDNILSLRSELMKKTEVPDLLPASTASMVALDAVLSMLNDAPKENQPIK